MDFEKWLQEHGIDAGQLNEEQKAKLKQEKNRTKKYFTLKEISALILKHFPDKMVDMDNAWYAFHSQCNLHQYGHSNMSAPSDQEYCKRKDKKGKEHTQMDWLKCHWNVCPRLKDARAEGLKEREVL